MKLFLKPTISIFAFCALLSCEKKEETPTKNPVPEILVTNPNEVTTSKTLLDKKGLRIRATPIAIGKTNFVRESVAFGKVKSNWLKLKNRGFNTVRICWVDPWAERRGNKNTWTLNEVAAVIDTYVENAIATDMNVIINYHNVAEYQKVVEKKTGKVYEPESFDDMKAFWKKIAPRYKDNDLVFYELNNEQVWSVAAYKSEEYKTNTKEVYDQVRKDAPERQVILFSFHSLALDMVSVVDDYDWIDWKYTSIGWHLYGNGNNPDVASEEANMNALISKYRTICTEWGWKTPTSDSYVKEYFGTKRNTQGLEEKQISWANWHGWNEPSSDYYKTLIDDAKTKGYWWAVVKK